MKKKYITALSIISTVCLLTLTACGNNNDASVSAMNDTPLETETTTVEETTTIIEETTTIEETITVEQTTIQDTSIADDEITEEDKATSATEATETLPFTIDDLDFPEENRPMAQRFINRYESGEIDYEYLLSLLADCGADIDDLLDDYLDQKYGTGTGSSTGTPQVVYPDGYDAAAAGLLDEAPPVTVEAQPLHPELSNIHVIP